MQGPDDFLKEFHWLMDVLQDIDVGLVVLDKNFTIHLWNSFMQNHSATFPTDVLGQNLFELFPEVPENWFKRKVQTIFMLQTPAFTTWEQRPYLFKFRNYRPVTGNADFMYQNCTIIPLSDTSGQIEHICIIIYDVTEVAVNRTQLQDANRQLHVLSRTDGLTGLLNRKAWENELENEFKRYQRNNNPCSLIMFDIDHFKKVNDNYGHPAGDEVIRETSRILRETQREIDVAGRYGGEEFAVILLNCNDEGAKTFAERLRKAIEKLTVAYEDMEIKFTISLGISELDATISSPKDWLNSADKGLYQAKENGRNNSVIYKKT